MSRLLALLSLAAMTPLAVAKPLVFDYKDPKEISAVSLTLDSMLEPIVGYAKGLSGTLAFDPQHPERTTGTIAVDVSSVKFANDGYTQTAQGYALNGKKWPQLKLAIRKVESVKKVSATRYAGVVLADFTCRGVTKPKRLQVTADYHPGRAEERTNGAHKGDLLILRTRFSVSRREHGISDGIPGDLVGDNIEVGVAVVGIRYQEEKALVTERRWEVEVQERDDPFVAQVERSGDTLRFRVGEKSVDAKAMDKADGSVAFQLQPNAAFGELKGEFHEKDGRLSGVLHTKDGDLGLRGKAVSAFVAPATVELKGQSFPELDLPKRMKEAGTSGMAVARILNGRITEIAHFGVKKAGENASVDGTTLFQAGSMGHPVLHLTALRLAASGKLDLDRLANAYLGTDAIPEGPKGWGGKVTVRDLMMGTSGFPHAKFAGLVPDAGIPTVRTSLGNLEVATEPGSTNGVSATNEALLELVVAKAAGKPAPQAIQELVFTPCGITRSTYEAHPATAATGHYSGGLPTLDGYHVYPAATESGLWTNAEEFGALLLQVGKILRNEPNALLRPEDHALFERIDGPKSVLGIRKGEDGYYLGGDPYGFFCEFFLGPEAKEGVLVLQNRMMAWRLCNDVVEAVRKTGR